MYQILSKTEMAQGTVVANEIMAPKIAAKAKPGQFVMLRVNETGERIPLTMADTDPVKGTITIIYQVVGKTTALLKSLNVMDHIQDVVGPLGQPTPIEKKGTVICVGGGTGVAVLHPITKAFKNAGNKVIAIIGARTKELIMMEDLMQAASHDFQVCTDDGSYCRQGFVTTLLEEQLRQLGSEVKEVVCIGPVPMMKACTKLTAEYGVPTIVSLNALMVDGTGMCGCCRVTVGNQTKFACVDGPEFDGHQVDFDILGKRLNAFKKEEKESMDLYETKCACAPN